MFKIIFFVIWGKFVIVCCIEERIILRVSFIWFMRYMFVFCFRFQKVGFIVYFRFFLFFVVQVQSFMRGWLCRRKWKIIVQDYICFFYVESMRKRNQIVFTMVEVETEYVYQFYILVNGFFRFLRMVVSFKKFFINYDDVSSIFFNRFVFV